MTVSIGNAGEKTWKIVTRPHCTKRLKAQLAGCDRCVDHAANANASDSMAANESETNGLRGAAPDSTGQKSKVDDVFLPGPPDRLN